MNKEQSKKRDYGPGGHSGSPGSEGIVLRYSYTARRSLQVISWRPGHDITWSSRGEGRRSSNNIPAVRTYHLPDYKIRLFRSQVDSKIGCVLRRAKAPGGRREFDRLMHRQSPAPPSPLTGPSFLPQWSRIQRRRFCDVFRPHNLFAASLPLGHQHRMCGLPARLGVNGIRAVERRAA